MSKRKVLLLIKTRKIQLRTERKQKNSCKNNRKILVKITEKLTEIIEAKNNCSILSDIK